MVKGSKFQKFSIICLHQIGKTRKRKAIISFEFYESGSCVILEKQLPRKWDGDPCLFRDHQAICTFLLGHQLLSYWSALSLVKFSERDILLFFTPFILSPFPFCFFLFFIAYCFSSIFMFYLGWGRSLGSFFICTCTEIFNLVLNFSPLKSSWQLCTSSCESLLFKFIIYLSIYVFWQMNYIWFCFMCARVLFSFSLVCYF